ncbi:MAG: hypothetical protein QM692_07395, partial [Thermomicrobiales bacterium]
MPDLTIGIINQSGPRALERALRALVNDHAIAGCDILVLDPAARRKIRRVVRNFPNATWVPAADAPCAAMDALFAAAQGEAVLVLAESARLRPGSLQRLRGWLREHPASGDLLTGPRVEHGKVTSTHLDPVWLGARWGTPARDPRGKAPGAPAFPILMQELDVFCCRRDAWPGLLPQMRGFGGEIGWLPEAFRRHGAQVLCLPGLRWQRRSGPSDLRAERLAVIRESTSPQRTLTICRNMLLGFAAQGLDTRFVAHRFRDRLLPGQADALWLQTLRDLEATANPQPLVSCLMPVTAPLPAHMDRVEEAVASFLMQDYPLKELILFNDNPGQKLVCDAPGVRVVNVSAQSPSLGAAFNAAAAYAQGDILAAWDPAVISLPRRLSAEVQALGSQGSYRPAGCWFQLDDELQPLPARPDGGQVGVMTREAFRGVGGYPSRTLGLHREMDAALAALAGREPAGNEPGPRETWQVIIRRWQEDTQYEGDPFLDPWQARAQGKPKRGRFTVQPRWRQDYAARCSGFVAAGPDPTPGRAPAAYVLGRRRRRGQRHFPRLDQRKGESAAAHLERVAALLDALLAAGGTRLIVPRAEADWLAQHVHVQRYLT